MPAPQKAGSALALPAFVVWIRGSAEPQQDASELLVGTLWAHLAPREAGISCTLARTTKAGSASARPVFFVRIRGNAEPLQDASEFLTDALSVHLAPERSGGCSSPLARTKNREGVARRLRFCLCTNTGQGRTSAKCRRAIFCALSPCPVTV